MLTIRAGFEVVVRNRIDKHLLPNSTPPLISSPNGGHGGKVASGAVSDERDILPEMAARPSRRRVGVFDRRREGMFRGQPVRDAHHDATRLQAQDPTHRIELVESAYNPTPAVEVHDDTRPHWRGRPIYPKGQWATRAVDHD